MLEPVGEKSRGVDEGPSICYRDIDLKTGNNGEVCVNIERTVLYMEEDVFQIFMMQQPVEQHKKRKGANSPENPLSVIKALNRSQLQLQGLEEKLQTMFTIMDDKPTTVLEEINAIENALAGITTLLQNTGKKEDRRKLAVPAMNHAIQYWMETTGESKFDLARQSRLWKVYTNKDGWERAQTLDKYLDAQTLPNRPRWNLITATCDFVLASSSESSPLRHQLEAELAEIRGL